MIISQLINDTILPVQKTVKFEKLPIGEQRAILRYLDIGYTFFYARKMQTKSGKKITQIWKSRIERADFLNWYKVI